MKKLFYSFLIVFSLLSIHCDNSTESKGEKIGAVCKDGTRFTATGSGACSGHGGVDHWLYR